MMNGTTSVAVKDLSLSFGALSVLDSLDIEVGEGEFLVLLGPSGCGKSTLLNCIAGLLDISRGQVFIKGKNVTWDEPKDRGIGMVFQSYALYPQMTVRRNLSFGLSVARLPKAEIDRRVARASELLQIDPLLERKPAELSGGQRQRVAIGRALVRDVDVFLFDEPLSNLDAQLRSELRVEIKRLHRTLENTMIYVTHDQIEAMTLADRIAVMKSGVIQQLDTPDAIYHRPMNRFVAGFIGSPRMNFFEGTLDTGTTPAFRCGALAVDLSRYSFRTSDQGVDGGDTTAAGGPARKAAFGIRPEHIAVGDAAAGMPTRIEAEVDLVEPLGSDTLIWTHIAGHNVTIRTAPEDAPGPGSRIQIGFDPARASLFDDATGGRL